MRGTQPAGADLDLAERLDQLIDDARRSRRDTRPRTVDRGDRYRVRQVAAQFVLVELNGDHRPLRQRLHQLSARRDHANRVGQVEHSG